VRNYGGNRGIFPSPTNCFEEKLSKKTAFFNNPALAVSSEEDVGGGLLGNGLRNQLALVRPTILVGAMVGAVVCAVVLRWYHLAAQSLWLDETLTAWCAGVSLKRIVLVAQGSDFPPLYFMMARWWTALFGNSEVALRSLSAFAGTLSLPVFYALCKKVLNDRMAEALALWLFAFSIMQVWFSREARTYEMGSFVALVSLYELVLFLEERTAARLLVIAACIAVSIYLHNMLFFYILALDITWLTYPSIRSRTTRLKEVAAANALAAVFYLPWLPSLINQVHSKVVGGFWMSRPTFLGLFKTLCILSGFSPDYLSAVAARLLPLPEHAIWVGVLFGIGVLCTAMVAAGFWLGGHLERQKIVSLLLYGLIPVFAVFAVSWASTPVFLDRIFTNSSLIFPIIFAFPLAVQKNRSKRALLTILGVILAGSAALSTVGYLRYTQKEDWRGATASVLSIPQDNRLVVFVAQSIQIPFDYYLSRLSTGEPPFDEMGLPVGYREAIAHPDMPDISISSADQIRKLAFAVNSRKYSEIDLVLSHDIFGDPHGIVLDYLNRSFSRREQQTFYGVKVIRFSAPSNDSKGF
jgi:mannosyltransferase